MPLNSLDILVPALAGYLFLRNSRLTWFRLVQESGYHLVFWLALVGLAFYVAGWIVAVFAPIPVIDRGLSAALWTVGLAFALAWALNAAYPPEKAERLAARWSRDYLARLVDLAAEDPAAGKAVETIDLTLRDGKTYIGYVHRARHAPLARCGEGRCGCRTGVERVQKIRDSRADSHHRLRATAGEHHGLAATGHRDPAVGDHPGSALRHQAVRRGRVRDTGSNSGVCGA